MFQVLAFFMFFMIGVCFVMLGVLLSEIGWTQFHQIPDHAKAGNKLAKSYLRIVYSCFAFSVAIGLWALWSDR
jgi:hypothetical protein